MTIIAGVIGAGASRTSVEECRRALAAQQRFADTNEIELAPADFAVLGSSLGGLASGSDRTDPRLCVVADARIDNRADVASDLGLSRSELPSINDAALLLLAWSKWGQASLDRLVGVFAFVLHDRSSNRTFLVRDPLGERPLSYAIRGERLAFASMPSGVWSGEPPSPDLSVLARIYRNFRLPPDVSYFHGISRVPPGHFVEFHNGAANARPYWRPRPVSLPTDHKGLVSAFREVFDVAVASRLTGPSAPQSTMLSSGFDSSTVTGTAARLLDQPQLLTAYTSAPARNRLLLPVSRFADETAVAGETARMLGVQHRVIRDDTPILSGIRGLTQYFQAPAPNPMNLGWWRSLLDEVRKTGQSNILVGTAGNHTISFGGSWVLPAFLRRLQFFRWSREMREIVGRHTHLRWRGALYSSVEPWLTAGAIRFAEKLFNRRTYYSELDFVRADFGSFEAGQLVRFTGDLVKDRLSLLTLNDNGERYKGMAALTGVEERDPTSDRRLIEFCLSLGPEHLLKDGEPRPLAKEAFSDRMSPKVLDFTVRGYQSADWYDRLLQSDAFALLDEIRNTGAADLLNIPKLEAAIRAWPSFDASRHRELYAFGHNICQALKMGLFVAEAGSLGGGVSGPN